MVAAIYDTSGLHSLILLLILTLGTFAGWIGAYTASRKYCQKACGRQYAEYAGRAIKPEAKRPQTILSMPEWFKGAFIFHLILYSAT